MKLSPYNICSLVYTPRPVTPAPDVESARYPPTDKEHVWNNTVTFIIMKFLPFAVTWTPCEVRPDRHRKTFCMFLTSMQKHKHWSHENRAELWFLES